MRTCIILNEHAGTAHQSSDLLNAISASDEMEHRVSTSAGAGRTLAREAAENGFECVAAAGGDGTINEVLNGIMESGNSDVRLGIIPLGTGNDLARTLRVPLEPRDALALIANESFHTIDLFTANAEDETRYVINASAGGFSGQVDEILTEEMKRDWGPLAFLAGAAQTLPDLKDFDTQIVLDGEPLEASSLVNVIVANGRTVAGGKRVAPKANPSDGLLDVVLVKWCTLIELAEVGARLLAGDYLESEHVIFRRAREVKVRSNPGMWFNLDGELFTNKPITFTVKPGAIDVSCGEDFLPEPGESRLKQLFNRKR